MGGERGPAGFAVAEPIEQAGAAVDVYGMGADAWGFIDHEQVVVFEEYQGREG